MGTLLLPLAMVIALGTASGSAEAKFARLARVFISAPLDVESDTFIGYTASQPLSASAVDVVAAVPGVAAALPQQNTFVDLGAEQAILYVIPLSRAIEQGVADALRDADLAEDPDAFRSGLQHGGIAISRLMARDRGLGPGDELSLPTPAGAVLFPVTAVFDDLAGLATIYMDRDTYVRHWSDTGSFRIGVVPESGADPTALRTAVEEAVRAASLPAVVTTREEGIAGLTAGLTQLFSIARAIQLAALLVAAFSLAGTAFTVILERRWAFGLQRTLGMSRRQLARSLALESVAIGVLATGGATITGLALGALLCRGFGLVVASPISVVVPWTVLASCVVVGIGLAALATLQPRRVATRTPIITALRTGDRERRDKGRRLTCGHRSRVPSARSPIRECLFEGCPLVIGRRPSELGKCLSASDPVTPRRPSSDGQARSDSRCRRSLYKASSPRMMRFWRDSSPCSSTSPTVTDACWISARSALTSTNRSLASSIVRSRNPHTNSSPPKRTIRS